MADSPEEAVTALAAAAASKDTNALRLLFGPAAVDRMNPDVVQASDDFIEFNTAFNQAQRIVGRLSHSCGRGATTRR
jgi:hypothetical protein